MPVCHVVCACPGKGPIKIDRAEGDVVIAADGGYARCLELGISPDIVIGDFDSLGAPPDAFAGELLELPVEKDDTDTFAALKLGLERGYKRFELHNALGGDLGHTLANLHALAWLKSQGAFGELAGQGQRAFLAGPEDGEVALGCPVGTRVSVFAFGGAASGVSEKGLHWELSGGTMGVEDSYGSSNFTEIGGARVSVNEGLLAVVVG